MRSKTGLKIKNKHVKLVFIVRFHCKGCVLERESVKTQATED